MERGSALLAVPKFARPRFFREAYTGEVEPFVHAGTVVTSNHVPIRHVVAEAVRGFLPRPLWHSICLGVIRARSALLVDKCPLT